MWSIDNRSSNVRPFSLNSEHFLYGASRWSLQQAFCVFSWMVTVLRTTVKYEMVTVSRTIKLTAQQNSQQHASRFGVSTPDKGSQINNTKTHSRYGRRLHVGFLWSIHNTQNIVRRLPPSLGYPKAAVLVVHNSLAYLQLLLIPFY